MMGTLPLAFGVAFQTPVAVCIAARFGLVKVESLRKGRPYSIVLILIIAAVLTPPDVISQVLVAVPMALLYELGIWLAARFEKKGGGVEAEANADELESAPAVSDSPPQSIYDESEIYDELKK